jgi:hypothetical protein
MWTPSYTEIFATAGSDRASVLGWGREGTTFAHPFCPSLCIKFFDRGTSKEQRLRSWNAQCDFLYQNMHTRLVPALWDADESDRSHYGVPFIVMERIFRTTAPSTSSHRAQAICQSQRLEPAGTIWTELLSLGNWALCPDAVGGIVFFEGGRRANGTRAVPYE